MSHPRDENQFLPRDYIATYDGLIFAVVGFDRETERVLGYLRYVVSSDTEESIKVSAQQTQELLQQTNYLWHCPRRDCVLPAIPFESIVHHYRPEDAAAQLVAEHVVANLDGGPSNRNTIRNAAATTICSLVEQGIELGHIGVTGSILLERATQSSDIDFVLYGRAAFARARDWVRYATLLGLVQQLSLSQWEETWRRRGCPMTCPEYVWHEQRKLNKGFVAAYRFDLNLVQERLEEPHPGTKNGLEHVEGTVVNADASFDWPATYDIDHPTIRTIQTFTATYFGQAAQGERIVARGMVEELSDGSRRLVIGLDRDAEGHYLKVVTP